MGDASGAYDTDRPSLYGTEDRLPIGIAWRGIALLSLIGWGIFGAVVYGLLW